MENIVINVTVRALTQEEAASVLSHIADLIMTGYKKGVGEGEDDAKYIFEVKENV